MDERKQKVLELRKLGWAWLAIGNYFGISRARAHQIGSGYKCGQQEDYREYIYQRDNYSCQWQEKCKGKFSLEDLLIHHMDFNDENNNPKNLITLCQKCHIYFHRNKKFHSEKPFYRKEYEEEQQRAKMKLKNQKWYRKCAGCKKEFFLPVKKRWNYYRNPDKFKGRSYCSRECFHKYWKGHRADKKEC